MVLQRISVLLHHEIQVFRYFKLQPWLSGWWRISDTCTHQAAASQPAQSWRTRRRNWFSSFQPWLHLLLYLQKQKHTNIQNDAFYSQNYTTFLTFMTLKSWCSANVCSLAWLVRCSCTFRSRSSLPQSSKLGWRCGFAAIKTEPGVVQR